MNTHTSTPRTAVNLTTGLYEVVIDGHVIVTPFATSTGHAIALAINLHRSRNDIPTNVQIRHTSVTRIPLVIGTTVPSQSGTAKVYGRKVSA